MTVSKLVLPHFPSLAHESSLGMAKRWLDPMHFSAFVKLLARLVSDLHSSQEQPIHATLESGQSGRLSFTVHCTLSERTSVEGSFPSLTALFSQALHLDLIEPPLIDAAASASQIGLSATLQQGQFVVRCALSGTDALSDASHAPALGARP